MTTPLPTLIQDREQVKLARIREALRCFASHLWITKDPIGHVFPFPGCPRCNSIGFCRKARNLIKEVFNGY